MPNSLKITTPENIRSAWIMLLDILQKNKNSGKNQEKNRWMADLLHHESLALKQMWQIFTQERGALRKNLLNTPKTVSTYVLGFHLPNVMRVTAIWKNFLTLSKTQEALQQSSSVLIYDLGCGTGSFSQALLAQLNAASYSKNITVRLVD